MWLVAFLVLMLFAGARATRAVWTGTSLAETPFLRASTSALFALAIGLAISWALALPHLLTREHLLGSGLVVAAFAGWTTRRADELPSAVARVRAFGSRLRATFRRDLDAETAETLRRIATLLAWTALASWCAFALWRGATVFSPNHDGVAYHLPKGAMIALAHGYQTFDGPDVRVSFWPCDYELLLADAIVLDGNDLHTAWVSTASLVAFLLAVGALAERWWGRGPQVTVAILLAAAMPVVLLMSDAHKNDLMTVALFIAAVAATSRWAVFGEPAAALTAIVAVAVTVGTKGSALFLLLALLPVAGWGAVHQWHRGRRMSLPRLAGFCAGAAATVLLVGGVVFVRNLLDTGHVMPPDPENAPAYDGFANLWHFPVLAFLRPFALSSDDIWVPWLHAYRHWGRHDLFFSEWGFPASLLLLALPFGIARYGRRRERGEAAPSERFLAAFAFVVLFLLFLPLRMQKLSILAATGQCRFTIFLPVLIALFTAVPAVANASARARVGVAAAAVLGCSLLFSGQAVGEGMNDLYEPFDYVREIAHHPEDRHSRRSGQNYRAAVIVDRLAGPNDEIAFDGGFDGWSYYCFGRDLGRKVTFLHPERGLPVKIPETAKWVVVDRIINIEFGHPVFVATGDWSYLGRGTPSAEDRAVYDQMLHDPSFKLVYSFDEKNQAVFERVL
jgi:hypothetical protein